MFELGDILQGSRCGRLEAFHYFIYLEGNPRAPVAAVLTSAGDYPCNVRMCAEQFESFDETGGAYKVRWRGDKQPSFLVAHRFQKLADWGPFQKVGKLSEQGVECVVMNIDANEEVLLWDEYEASGCPLHN